MSRVRNLQKATARRFLAWLSERWLPDISNDVKRSAAAPVSLTVEERFVDASNMVAMGKRTRALKVDAR